MAALKLSQADKILLLRSIPLSPVEEQRVSDLRKRIATEAIAVLDEVLAERQGG